MENTIICGLPIIWTLGCLYGGYLVGRYGIPLRWTGWHDRRAARELAPDE
jgi:hypothetical protein